MSKLQVPFFHLAGSQV